MRFDHGDAAHSTRCQGDCGGNQHLNVCGRLADRDRLRGLNDPNGKVLTVSGYIRRLDAVGLDFPVNFDSTVGGVDLVEHKVIVEDDVAVVAGQCVDATIDLTMKNDVSFIFYDQAIVGHGENDALR